MPGISYAARLRRDERGTTALLFGLVVFVCVGVAGLSFDMARAHRLSGKVSSALDSAALAAARSMAENGSLTDAEVRQIATNFILAHTANLGPAGLTLGTPAIVLDRSQGSVSITTSLSVATTFGRVLTINSLDFARTASVAYNLKKVELAIALDITGSMNSEGKLQHVKNAAKDVLQTLLDGALDENSVRVALVPWSSAVNAGTLANVASNGASVDNCVVERTGSEAATDAGPAGINYSNAVTELPYGHYQCNPNPVVALSGRSQLSALKTIVDNYVATGWTAGHIGTAWGWYMVSPEWASVLPAANKPLAYDTSKVIKSVIIMTDGLFNTSYVSGSETPESTMTTESYQAFQSLCANMKAKGIIVYTVGFDLGGEATATQQLRDCATSAQHFYLPANGNDLNVAFQSIASQLTQLRLTK
ncbi:MAG: hypothetical protein F9K44_02255 [Hyphomicrobiaceae bacterium]|nr:MAG: hypothetical protein F9K44_02255 [Hyphomicrobiaceae bacterium]